MVPNSVSIRLDRLSVIDAQRDSNWTMTESALILTNVQLEFTIAGTIRGSHHLLTNQFAKIQKALIRAIVTLV